MVDDEGGENAAELLLGDQPLIPGEQLRFLLPLLPSFAAGNMNSGAGTSMPAT